MVFFWTNIKQTNNLKSCIYLHYLPNYLRYRYLRYTFTNYISHQLTCSLNFIRKNNKLEIWQRKMNRIMYDYHFLISFRLFLFQSDVNIWSISYVYTHTHTHTYNKQTGVHIVNTEVLLDIMHIIISWIFPEKHFLKMQLWL